MSHSVGKYTLSNREEVIYSAADTDCYSIRVFDWNRLKGLATRSQQKRINLQIIYSILYGIAGTTGFSIIPLTYSEGIPNWVVPLYVLITIFSFFFAVILTFMDRYDTGKKVSDLDEIKAHMEDIERLYIKQIPSKILAASNKITREGLKIPFDDRWAINFWESSCARKEDNKIIFEGGTAPKGSEVCYIDIEGRLEIGQEYIVSCFARSIQKTTGKFTLWLHDDILFGGNPRVTVKPTPRTITTSGETQQLSFKPVRNSDIRIHLWYIPGRGRIEISDVRINPVV